MTEQLTSHPQLAEMGFAYPMLIEGDINTLTPAAEQLADLLERASEVVTVVSETATSDTEFDTAIVSFMNEAVESGKEDMAVGAGVLSISEPGEQPKVAEMVVGDLPSGTVIDMLRYVNDEEATREILAVVESQLNGPSAGSDTTLELPVARHNFDEKPKSTLDKEGHLDRLVAHTKYEIPQLTDEVLGGGERAR